MVITTHFTNLAYNVTVKNQNGKVINGNGNGLRFASCPRCDRKGYDKVPRSYEHCRFCGLHRILLPGQDF